MSCIALWRVVQKSVKGGQMVKGETLQADISHEPTSLNCDVLRGGATQTVRGLCSKEHQLYYANDGFMAL